MPADNMSLLTHVFRQKNNEFVQLLEDVRKGSCSPKQIQMLKKCSGAVRYEGGAEPVGL